MKSVWSVSKLSTESVGSRRELVAIVYTPPTRRNSTVESRRRWRCVLGIIHVHAFILHLTAPESEMLSKQEYHRLNGSSSPVLTATCLSYWSLCDFLTFFRNTPGGQTPQPIFTQNGSTRRGFTHRCAFCSKNRNFV